ncbi:MAG: hypothetical protein KAR17_10655, partial [Cyclobacteriaceae bacterium]|nr:hypothetical protein [Cyclobacteriaceae bacterium]
MFYKKTILIVLSFFLQISWINAKEVAYPINLILSVEGEIKSAIKSEGRLFIFLSTQSNREPRTLTWPTAENYVFAKNINDLNANVEIVFPASEDWKITSEWSLKKIPEGTYYLQVLWDQDREESGINAPENIYSLVKKMEVNKSVEVEISLSE